jgi:hypothetical protein
MKMKEGSLGNAVDQFGYLIFEIFGLDPGIEEHFFCFDAVGGIYCQHFGDEILYAGVHICWEVELELVVISLLLALAILWEVAQRQPV